MAHRWVVKIHGHDAWSRYMVVKIPCGQDERSRWRCIEISRFFLLLLLAFTHALVLSLSTSQDFWAVYIDCQDALRVHYMYMLFCIQPMPCSFSTSQTNRSEHATKMPLISVSSLSFCPICSGLVLWRYKRCVRCMVKMHQECILFLVAFVPVYISCGLW